VHKMITCAVWLCCSVALSQQPVRLPVPVEIEAADAATRTRLLRAKTYIDNEQWDEAILEWQRILQDPQHQLVSASPEAAPFSRYISVQTYCQMQMASLHQSAPDALTRFRQQTDRQVEIMFQQAMAQQDEQQLLEIVDQHFISSFADDALLSLGDLAFERGALATARDYWQRISPMLRQTVLIELRAGEKVYETKSLLPKWFARPGGQMLPLSESPVYPDSQIPVADLISRLVLVSIIEGDRARADYELAWLRQVAPQAQGKLGGKTVIYEDALQSMLSRAQRWPATKGSLDWPTFAGGVSRSGPNHASIKTANNRWSVPLPNIKDSPGRGIGPLHPVASGDRLFVCDTQRIWAFDMRMRRPLWPVAGSTLPGLIYRAPRPTLSRQSAATQLRRYYPSMTIAGDRLFARLEQDKISGRGQLAAAPSIVVGLDLKSEGLQLLGFPLRVKDETWDFAGPPVCDTERLYIAVRQSEARTQLYIACFRLNDGHLLWQQPVCTGEYYAGQEKSPTVLTLGEGELYINTNLGCIASLRPDVGQIRWITTYPRNPIKAATPAALLRPSPCLFYRGLVFASPHDAGAIVALDSSTGQAVWSTALSEQADLVGVSSDHLIASGSRLTWYDLVSGRLADQSSENGVGHAVVASKQIYWPNRDRIYVLSQDSARQTGPPIKLAISAAISLTTAANRLIVSGDAHIEILSDD